MPSVTGETQPIMRIVDVFPAPFGPRKPKASPRWRSKSIAVDGDEVAEALDEVARLDQRLAVVARHPIYVSYRVYGLRARFVASTSRAICSTSAASLSNTASSRSRSHSSTTSRLP